VESWPARWRDVRRRSSGSRRWSPPRPLLLVPGWCTSSLFWRGTAFLGGEDVLAPGPVLGSSLVRRGGGAPAFSLESVQVGVAEEETPSGGKLALPLCPPVRPLLNRRREQLDGKSPQCPWLAAGRGRWRSRRSSGPPRVLGGEGSGVKSLFPRSHPVPHARAGPWRACRPGGPAALHPARAGGAEPAVLPRLGVLVG
jgi:hypothetical protein